MASGDTDHIEVMDMVPRKSEAARGTSISDDDGIAVFYLSKNLEIPLQLNIQPFSLLTSFL